MKSCILQTHEKEYQNAHITLKLGMLLGNSAAEMIALITERLQNLRNIEKAPLSYMDGCLLEYRGFNQQHC